jgi:hypothetical protein
MSKSFENLLLVMFGKSPIGTAFAERERERESTHSNYARV